MLSKIAFSIGDWEITAPPEVPSGGIGTTMTVISNLIVVLVVAGAILTLIFLIWGGISWITSLGDKQKLDLARKKIIYAIVGLFLILFSFLVISLIGSLFGVDLLGTS